MKQVLQSLKTGATSVLDVPAPQCPPGHILIATRRSLISAGTERTLVEFGQANLIQKAMAQPERVRQVLDKMRTDGIAPTLEAVFAKLDEPLPLGYCNAGVVIEVGADVDKLAVGDRVVSNGPHAEIVCVPKNLCVRIPDDVDNDAASFTVLAAVGLQGIRLAAPTLGEAVVVMGLGLVGLLTVQILVANGCRVLGIDFDAQKLALAQQYGATTVDLSAGADPIAAGMAFTHGRGVDAVLITASSKSDELMHQAAQMSRKRGRIVLVGVVGLSLSRADFYEKELSFQVSCSYGPGRYDEAYEQAGHDYPLGFVRWTEQRNFEAILDLLTAKRLDVSSLISHRFPHHNAADAYKLLTDNSASLGILLEYPEHTTPPLRTISYRTTASNQTAAVVVGMIGVGNFGSRILLPALSKTSAALHTVVSAGGTSATLAAQRFSFQQASSDYTTVLNNPQINTVFIATRHNSHAKMTIEALQAGKHVFVEKPLALNRAELDQIEQAVKNAPGQQFMVGFNRRFAPLTVRLRALLAARSQPCSLVYTVNAGHIPANHWTQDPHVGGGRIIGEVCHFIDLLLYLVGQQLIGVEAQMVGRSVDIMTILLDFADGSTGVVHYLANGSKSFPKERVEAFSEGRVAVLDNFRTLRGYGWPTTRVPSQDKGHQAEIAAFIQRVTDGGDWLIPWSGLRDVTLATFAAVERAAETPRGLI